jgi:hypothetical protein
MTTDTEALLRRAYHLAEGDVLDARGFIDLFAEDGVFNGIGGVSGQESYRGEQLGDVIVFMGKFLPDVHQELHRVNVLGDVVAIELSVRGTLLGAVPDARGRDPAHRGQARHPDRRLLICARRQDQGVQLPYRCGHHVRAAVRTAGINLRSRGVRARTIRPTDTERFRRRPARRHAPSASRRPHPSAGSRPGTARSPPAPAVSCRAGGTPRWAS